MRMQIAATIGGTNSGASHQNGLFHQRFLAILAAFDFKRLGEKTAKR